MQDSWICQCGTKVAEDTQYDDSDQPYIALFEVDPDNVENLQAVHRCPMLEVDEPTDPDEGIDARWSSW